MLIPCEQQFPPPQNFPVLLSHNHANHALCYKVQVNKLFSEETSKLGWLENVTYDMKEGGEVGSEIGGGPFSPPRILSTLASVIIERSARRYTHCLTISTVRV